MTASKPRRHFRRVIGAVLAAILIFAAWSAITLPVVEPIYADADRIYPGGGAVLPRSTGRAGDWAGTGGDPGGSQWSPLSQIDRDNVAGLKIAWTHHSGDFIEGDIYTGTRAESIPLIVGDTLYYCTPFDRVFALDAASGARRWSFDPYARGNADKALFDYEMKPKHCRGVAYWKDSRAPAGKACAQRIFRSAGQLSVVAVDALTGRTCTDFGAAAGHPGYVSHGDFDWHGGEPSSATSPPIVIDDVLIAAMGARDNQRDAADGIVRGFDARDGTLLWEFNPIPEEFSAETGAANVWTLLSGDPDRGMVFLATTSPSPDYYGGTRNFDMPLTNAVVAVKAATGEIAWSYQVVRHELFDYDLPTAPMLATIAKDGAPRDVVIQATKHGYVFVLDRDNGKPVFPVEERRVPQSVVPGENASPTQPVPLLPDPFGKVSVTRDEMFGVTPIDRAWCRRKFDSLRYEGLFTPPDPQGSLVLPSSMGGTNWGGATFDPVTNLLIVRADNLASTMAIRKVGPGFEAKDFMTREIPDTGLAASGQFFLSPLGIPCMPPPWGTLTAIDMDSGRIAWQVPMGRSHRFGITVPAFLNWGSPGVGGPIATAGGLVFVGAALDGAFRAFDIRTGRQLWQASIPAPGMAVPATYEVGGKQYVAITSGGNSMAETKIGDALVVFALPD